MSRSQTRAFGFLMSPEIEGKFEERAEQTASRGDNLAQLFHHVCGVVFVSFAPCEAVRKISIMFDI